MDNIWKTATKDDRAALYHVARAVADTTNLSVEAIMEQAFGHKLMVGTDYLSNFRSGTIGRPKAKLIHAWIVENHAETAHAVEPRLFPKQHTDAWGDYLERHAVTGKLRIARFDKSMRLVRRKLNQSNPDEILKLGEEFCFELDNDTIGYAVAFQLYKGAMHPLPLGLNEEPTTNVYAGTQFLPVREDGIPEKLTETDDLGQHLFTIFVADELQEFSELSRPPVDSDRIRIYVTTVQIIP